MNKSKLSFNMDDEDDAEEVFVAKKDTNNKTIKKMRQAPPSVTLPQVLIPTPSYLNSGSSYNNEYLEQLRNNQKFVAKTSGETSTAMEGVILNGEAAEQFTNITEKLNKNAMQTDNLFTENLDSVDDSADFMAFKTGQMTSKSLLKGKSDNRLSMQSKTNSKETFHDMIEENDEDWEQEVMRRGVISSSGSTTTSAGDKQSSGTIKGSSLDTGFSGDKQQKESHAVTLEDVAKLVQMALDRLKVSSAGHDRQISTLAVSREKAEGKRATLQVKLDGGVDRLNVIQDIRIFFAALVGMLRVKQPLIEQLRDATFKTIGAQCESRRHQRIEEQEDWLFRVKEAGELMTVGDYVPSATLNSSSSNSSSELATREGDRRFVRLQILNDPLAICDGSSLTQSDRAHFIAGRVDLIEGGSDSFGKRRILYDLLETQAIARLQHSSEYAAKLSVLRSAQTACMEDVAPEVFSMTEIVSKLSAFRTALPDKYRSAFISLSLPEVLELLVMFDVLGCSATVFSQSVSNIAVANNGEVDLAVDEVSSSPSVSICPFSIGDRAWHEPLREFSASDGSSGGVEVSGGDETVESLVEEGDANLLPRLVVSSVLPWLIRCVQTQLDPLDTSSCRQCADLIGQVLDYDPGAGPLGALLEAVVGVFEAELAVTCVPVVKQGDSGLGRAFLERQLNRVSLLLENISLFREYLSPSVVVRIAWRVLASLCLAPLLKMLSAPDFQHVEVVYRLVTLSLSLLSEQLQNEMEEEVEVTLNSFTSSSRSGMRAAEHVRLLVTCGVNMGAHRELKAAVERIDSLRNSGGLVNNNEARMALYQALSRI